MVRSLTSHLPNAIRDPLRRAVSGLIRAYRRAVPRDVLLPGFLIIGVMKGGTSALFYYLRQHPQVRLALSKEPHYFDLHYGWGLNWYRVEFPARAPGVISGEASPYYIFHPLAPSRARQTVPDARIIVLLREPVSRAYSHYHHMLRRGEETLPFEEAIAAEADRLKGETERIRQNPEYFSPNHMYYSYLGRGHYAEQIEAWREHFPPEQMLILSSEDFFARPGDIFAETVSFLGLAPRPLRYAPQMNKGSYPPMNPATRQRLREYFHPHNLRLYELVGRDFGWDR